MVQLTRISAQNSQYSSTGVGFQIRNDLNGHTSAIYPLFPSQARLLRRAHTSMRARIAATRLLFCIRVRHQTDPKSRPNRNNFRCTLSTSYPQSLVKFTTAPIQLRVSTFTTTTRQLICASSTSRQHLHNNHDTTTLRPHNNRATTTMPLNNYPTTPDQLPTNPTTAPQQNLQNNYHTTTKPLPHNRDNPNKPPTKPSLNTSSLLAVHLGVTCTSATPFPHLGRVQSGYNPTTFEPHS